MNKKEIFEKIIKYLLAKEAKKIAVFDSYVRGEEKVGSDIEIIFEFSVPKAFLTL